MPKRKAKILIVDDAQINRIILCELLRNQYQILEAEDGKKALEMIKEDKSIDLVLLDIVMPNMDGYQVLEKMKEQRYLEYLPVIIISSEGDTTSMEKAYELGATDYIRRPFESYIINRRIKNTLMLYEKQKKLVHLVEQQIQKRVNNNTTLINVLGHIVEFRNGESGLHIQHIQTITKMLLLQMGKKSHEYKLSDADILLISTASSLHDIGKMFIPPSILQKPAKLTDEEYEIMKTHTTIGYKMCMNDLNLRPYSAGAKYHHEALNGKGYPEGLAGDKIPIEAQIIRVADEFDAIVSKRQYKSHIGIVDTLKILIENAHNGKNNLPATKALKKVVIDDTIYEISSAFNYVDYLKENIKRLKQIKKYHDKMISASSEKQKNLEGMKLLFIAGETVDNCVSILADYENALSEKEKIIDKLNDELKEIKKLKI